MEQIEPINVILPLVKRASAWRCPIFLRMPALFAGVLGFVVFCWFPKSIADPDIWWHLRNVQEELNRHAMLSQDTYSWTATGAPWINYEWLSELPFYAGWRLWGEQGVYSVALVVTESIVLGVFLLASRRSGNLSAAGAAAMCAALFATISFGPRTLLFGWLCLIIELLLLEHWREGKLSYAQACAAFPVLFCFWANLHGSWLIGLVVFLLFISAGSAEVLPSVRKLFEPGPCRARSLWMPFIGSTAAVFLNPYGWRLAVYPFDMAFHQTLNVNNVDEWRSLDFHSGRGKIFLLYVAVFFITQLLRRARWRLHEVLWLLLGVYAACVYSRFLFLCGLLTAPILAWTISPRRRRARTEETAGQAVLHGALLAGLALTALLHFPSKAVMAAAERSSYPQQALAYLQNFTPQGPVLNEYLWGGYIEWHEKQITAFIDSRVDIFERRGVLLDYLALTQIKQPTILLNRYKIRYVFFPPQAPLIQLLEASGNWCTLYRDSSAVLLERRGASGCR